MTPQEIREFVAEENADALFADGFDDALIGVCNRFGMNPVAAYDYDKCILSLMRDGVPPMTQEEAVEFFDHNVIGSWMGENTPVFVTLVDLKTPPVKKTKRTPVTVALEQERRLATLVNSVQVAGARPAPVILGERDKQMCDPKGTAYMRGIQPPCPRCRTPMHGTWQGNVCEGYECKECGYYQDGD